MKLLESKLETLDDNKIKGGQIRSKAIWIEQDERNNIYFLNFEGQHQSSIVIRELNTSSEDVINKTNSIMGEMFTFYSNLYKSKYVSKDCIKEYLEKVVVTEIDENDKDMLNKFLSYEECTEAIFQTKN